MSAVVRRHIQASLNTDGDGLYELRVECDDEATSMFLMGNLDMFGGPDALAESLKGAHGAALAQEHVQMCESCKRWAAEQVAL